MRSPTVVIANDVLGRIETLKEKLVPVAVLENLSEQLYMLGIGAESSPDASRLLEMIAHPVKIAPLTPYNADDYSREVAYDDLALFTDRNPLAELRAQVIESIRPLNPELALYIDKKGVSAEYWRGNDERCPTHRRQSVVSHVAGVGTGALSPGQERNNFNILIHGKMLSEENMNRCIAAVESVAVLDHVISPFVGKAAEQFHYAMAQQAKLDTAVQDMIRKQLR